MFPVDRIARKIDLLRSIIVVGRFPIVLRGDLAFQASNEVINIALSVKSAVCCFDEAIPHPWRPSAIQSQSNTERIERVVSRHSDGRTREARHGGRRQLAFRVVVCEKERPEEL